MPEDLDFEFRGFARGLGVFFFMFAGFRVQGFGFRVQGFRV